MDAQLQPPLLTFHSVRAGCSSDPSISRSPLPLNADGVNPEAPRSHYHRFQTPSFLVARRRKAPILQAALLGQNGLRFQDRHASINSTASLEALTALEITSPIHAGVQMMSPGAETGLPFEQL